jgi:hypothetical protein
MGETLAWVPDLLLKLLPAGLWCAWWLWGVNWKNAWPVLAGGGWVPVLLLTGTSALAWSQIFPSSCNCLGFPIPNFWWQLGACFALVAAALFCGWLQERLGWAPAAVSFAPPEGHHHMHGPGHHGHGLQDPGHGGHH